MGFLRVAGTSDGAWRTAFEKFFSVVKEDVLEEQCLLSLLTDRRTDGRTVIWEEQCLFYLLTDRRFDGRTEILEEQCLFYVRTICFVHDGHALASGTDSHETQRSYKDLQTYEF